MRRGKECRNYNIGICLGLIFLMLFLLGADGCPAPGELGEGVATEAAKYGMDFALIPGIGYLSGGKEIVQGDTFYVYVKIENYDKKAKSGNICVRDSLEAVYGGIIDECRQFSIGAAIAEDESVKPAEVKMLFGPYSYHDIKIELLEAKAFVTASYVHQSIADGSFTILPEQETLKLNQLPSPIEIRAEKGVTLKDDQYNVRLKITFTKKLEAEIKSADFKKKGMAFTPTLFYHRLNCGEKWENFVGMTDDKNFISVNCFALLPKEEEVPYILQLVADYGVEQREEINFKIKKA